MKAKQLIKIVKQFMCLMKTLSKWWKYVTQPYILPKKSRDLKKFSIKK